MNKCSERCVRIIGRATQMYEEGRRETASNLSIVFGEQFTNPFFNSRFLTWREVE